MLDLTALMATLPAAGPIHALGPEWMSLDYLVEQYGTYAIIAVVLMIFVETGLLFPLLPGDSLLFTAGALVAQRTLDFPLWLLCLLLFLAAFLGDQTAYWIGRRVGPKLFNKPDSRIFKQEHIDQTNAYFEKYGGRTIIIARFIPFVRTYSAVSAGIGRMNYRHFVSYDVVGALLWGVGVTLLGYSLGTIPFIKNNIEALLILVVLVSVTPVAFEVLRKYLKSRHAVAAVPPTSTDPALAEPQRDVAQP